MDVSIKDAFVDGIYDVYSLMFTDQLLFSLLNTEATEVSVYGETSKKTYLEPVNLVGKISIGSTPEEDPVRGFTTTAFITIPVKSMILAEIPHDLDSIKILKQGKFTYKGQDFDVQDATPQIFIEDTFMAFKFECINLKKDSLGR